MPLPAFQKIFTDAYPVQKLQDHLAACLGRILNQPDTPKELISQVTLGTTFKDVPHMLGAGVTNYIVCRRSAPAIVYDLQSQNPVPNVSIRLIASASVTVDILVF